ncbi:cation transporter [Streptococcus catagoni]|uniref:cation transporter n=1 Tax=Streptococcus catagoni TaxID=2654874 RepID=UPI001409E784|nr:cation transporter [Streptococcus catagoni]
MNYKKIEKQALGVSTGVNFVNASAGIFVYIITGLNALLLDSVFSVIGFISSIAAVYIAKNSHKKTETYPNGMYFLEPLFGVLKSIATIMLLVIALLESSAVAYAYFVYGEGDPLITGPVLPYTLITGFLCFALAFYNRYKNKSIHNMSTMLKAESKANLIDGIISIGIGITVLILSFININGQLGFLHYTADFFITVILVLLSIKEPVDILIHSFKEFANSTVQNQAISEKVMEVFRENLHDYKDDLDINIHKQGMHINVRVFIINIEDIETIEELAKEKANLLNQLRKSFEQISLEFTF